VELDAVEERSLEESQEVRARRTDEGIGISVLDTARKALKAHAGIKEYRSSAPSHHRNAQREKVSAWGHKHKHAITWHESEIA
jgi:hypothetical protein